MEVKRRVLVVDEYEEMVRLISSELDDAGFDVIGATTFKRALELARESKPDAAVTDVRLPGGDGFALLEGLRALDPDLPVLVITASGTIENAVEAMRRGAASYVTKPFRTGEIALQVRRALSRRANRPATPTPVARTSSGSGGAPSTGGPPRGFIGTSAAMADVFRVISRVAPTDATVLIRGESGTGKEVVARAVHDASARRDRPFIALNSASVPAALLESELFGHVRGSFTGAAGTRRGLFLAADSGTLFLDEIGDMPIELQAHLLRVLEDRIVRPVGADSGRAVDVRIIAATHQDLEVRVAQGKFRADLFYRLDVLPISIPPLRARVDDIPALFASFCAACSPTRVERLGPEALAVLERYHWPGNVRELENLVRRLTVLVDHAIVTKDDLQGCAPHLFTARQGAQPAAAPAGVPQTAAPQAPHVQTPLERAQVQLPTLRQLETDYIAWVAQHCEGNKTRAAEVLGIDVSTIHRRLRGQERSE